MRFVILRLLKHNELGMFYSYRRMKKEKAKQRAINFDADVVDRVFPAARDGDSIALKLKYETDRGIQAKPHHIKRQHKNWRLEGNCPKDRIYDFVNPGCLFAMVVDSGRKPAQGAWAVYPKDHEVTKAITAHAESSQLTAHSMVALYESEGNHTLTLLCTSKPSLFGKPPAVQVTPGRKTQPTKSDPMQLPPNPKRLVKILASVGHSLPSAVADIVDNAISVDATEIRITFREPDGGHGRWMAITDNGPGMSRARLAEAMRIGSDITYEPGGLGRYGYGLKGASWSQASSFTVITKLSGKRPAHLSWDADAMDNWEVGTAELEKWVADEVDLGDHGTCVFWQDMRPPKHILVARGIAPYTAEIRDLDRHLGLVFHRFIEGSARGRKAVSITINGIRVSPNNPVGHTLAKAYDKKPIRTPTDKEDAYVNVQAFLLPSESEIKTMHGDDLEAAKKDLDRIGMYGRRNESQGLYIYRNDRLIQWGGWHQMWATSDEKMKLARVIVEFGSELDEQFAVNISKQKVTLPQHLQEHVKKLAEEARRESRKKYLDDESGGRVRSTDPKTRANDQARTATPNKIKPRGPDDPSADTGGNGLHSKPPIPVRMVHNAGFCWRITRNLSGHDEIQINDGEAELHSLADAVNADGEAVRCLVGFLRRLDRAEVQKVLFTGTDSR